VANGRRRALRAIGAGACLLIVRPAAATPEELAAALHETFGDRPITPGRVKLDIPRLAENGNLVPVVVSVDSPMSARTMAMIQNRITICGSVQPSCSK